MQHRHLKNHCKPVNKEVTLSQTEDSSLYGGASVIIKEPHLSSLLPEQLWTLLRADVNMSLVPKHRRSHQHQSQNKKILTV